MSTPLLTNQFELLDTNESSVLVFGTEDTGYLTINRPTHTSDEGSTGDTSRPNEDARMFGRDYRGGRGVALDMGVLTDTINGRSAPGQQEAANLDALDRIDGIWNDEKWRNRPDAYAVLRCCEANRTSRAYGRPRRYSEVAGNFTRLGYTPITCTFDIIDDRWYADVEQAETCTLIPSTDGGLTAPLVSPLTTTSASAAAASMAVGGTKPTWPVLIIHGPVVNPLVTIGTLTISLQIAISAGQTITFDPRPWRRRITRNDGASFAGAVMPPTPAMRDCTVKPGVYAILYRGSDNTGTSFVEIRWRDARSRP